MVDSFVDFWKEKLVEMTGAEATRLKLKPFAFVSIADGFISKGLAVGGAPNANEGVVDPLDCPNPPPELDPKDNVG